MVSQKSESTNAPENALRFKPHPVEISRAKRDLLDLVLAEVSKLEAYWRFRYRDIVSRGVGISYETSTDVGEIEGGLVVVWILKVTIPQEIWEKLAWYRKNKLWKRL